MANTKKQTNKQNNQPNSNKQSTIESIEIVYKQYYKHQQASTGNQQTNQQAINNKQDRPSRNQSKKKQPTNTKS